MSYVTMSQEYNGCPDLAIYATEIDAPTSHISISHCFLDLYPGGLNKVQ